jgi:hypothetical protein
MPHGFGLGFSRANGVTALTNRPNFGLGPSHVPEYIEDPTLARSQPLLSTQTPQVETFGLVDSADAREDVQSPGGDKDGHILDNDFVAFEDSGNDADDNDGQRDGVTAQGGPCTTIVPSTSIQRDWARLRQNPGSDCFMRVSLGIAWLDCMTTRSLAKNKAMWV